MGFDITIEVGRFSWIDYVVFGVLIAVSCSGGLWYSVLASRSKKVVDIRDYLLGGRNMSTFPVALSLIASYVSGVTVLGTPAEIYNYGSQYWLVCAAVFACGAAIVCVYLPVFCTLRLSSSYEYLELRFNKYVRAAASILFLLDQVLFLPMVVYVPALACNQLTGLNTHWVAGGMVLVCGLYTVLGGLRAVVWTDSLQTIIMFVGVVLTAAAGTVAAGGFLNVLSTAKNSERLSVDNFSPSMYDRQTVWGAVLGQFFYWTCYNSCNQIMVQRYLSVPSRRKAAWAIIWFCTGVALAISLCVWNGLVAWALWVVTGCSKGASPPVDDRLLPAFITYIAHHQGMTGLPGVFLAGVFGAGLSSLSASLNACALVGVEDLAGGVFRLRLKPLHEGVLARGISAALAVVALLMMFVIERLGGVLSVATTLSAVAASTTCGVFTLGMCCWWVGPKGALAGAVAGALVVGTVAAGSSVYGARGYIYPPLAVPDGVCPSNFTYVPPEVLVEPETVFPLFRLSYHWVAPLGLLTTLFFGAAAGWLLDRDAPPPHPSLMSPVVWRWLPHESWELPQKSRDLPHARGRRKTPDPVLLVPIDSADVDKVGLKPSEPLPSAQLSEESREVTLWSR